jgi:hypothetical protein
MDWEPAFIAVGVLLGEPLDAVRGALASPVPASGVRLLTRLAAPSREARARALGRVLAAVATALEDARLA